MVQEANINFSGKPKRTRNQIFQKSVLKIPQEHLRSYPKNRYLSKLPRRTLSICGNSNVKLILYLSIFDTTHFKLSHTFISSHTFHTVQKDYLITNFIRR